MTQLRSARRPDSAASRASKTSVGIAVGEDVQKHDGEVSVKYEATSVAARQSCTERSVERGTG